jgi:tetratricopeptide (TPR) repeat protein
VVHFDGHGTWADSEDLKAAGSVGGFDRQRFSVLSPPHPGSHGYLVFEDPGSEANQCLVDGPALGLLLAGTGVPVLVLNACRSAYAEARGHPADTSGADAGSEGVSQPVGGGEATLTGDVHARIRAYGSLAAEVADTGVPGVVAMRYNVYVVTAAQFVADLYAYLLDGKSLGHAATAARKALAANPVRQIGAAPVELQDWAVPIVYESAPLVLLRPQNRPVPLIRLAPTGTKVGADGAAELPRPPDAGFFGRDESLLALDRAFENQPIVLLQAYAGAGKSATAAEFARWYSATGGLDEPDHPEWPGTVLWSSFEHHLTADQVIGAAGDHFVPLLEGNGVAWAAVTDPAQRCDLVMQVLRQVPVLWVWDNVEPVTGFPEGTPSDWDPADQDGLAGLLRDLAQTTRCKVLLTSRRDEHPWLGDLPARVRLAPMPMRESLQLAAALAARHGHAIAGTDWRPLLRYAAGNPLTITVLIGQALHGSLSATEQIEGFVARLRAGEAQLEAGENDALGRTRSLAASLSYGFAEAFTGAERAQLAVLHLFRDAANFGALRLMGEPDAVGDDVVPELAGLTDEAVMALLERAVGIGLLESLGAGSGYYRIHPALPWYFTTLFTTSYGQPDSLPAQRVARAYIKSIGILGGYYHAQNEWGRTAQAVPRVGAEEANLRNALDLARAKSLWEAEVGCLQGLRTLYQRTGRDGEWVRLVAAITPDFTDPATSGPLPGREEYWGIVTDYRVRLARAALDWPTAATLLKALIAWHRARAAVALAAPAGNLTPDQRHQIRDLEVALSELGNNLLQQRDPGCLRHFEEALSLAERIGDHREEAGDAASLGNVYLHVPGLRNLDRAEHWVRHSLTLRPDSDRFGRAGSLVQLGQIALERFDDARKAGEAKPVLLKHLSAALYSHQQALGLTPAEDHQQRATIESQLGETYSRAGDTGQALRHYQQAIQHEETRGNVFGAGRARYNIALLLAENGRISDAMRYARAGLHNFEQIGPGAADSAANARRLIAALQHLNG